MGFGVYQALKLHNRLIASTLSIESKAQAQIIQRAPQGKANGAISVQGIKVSAETTPYTELVHHKGPTYVAKHYRPAQP